MKTNHEPHAWQVGDLAMETGKDGEPALIVGITDQDSLAIRKPGKKRRRKVNNICFVTRTGFAGTVPASEIDRFFSFTRRTDLSYHYQTRSQVLMDYIQGVFTGVFEFERVGESGQGVATMSVAIEI